VSGPGERERWSGTKGKKRTCETHIEEREILWTRVEERERDEKSGWGARQIQKEERAGEALERAKEIGLAREWNAKKGYTGSDCARESRESPAVIRIETESSEVQASERPRKKRKERVLVRKSPEGVRETNTSGKGGGVTFRRPVSTGNRKEEEYHWKKKGIDLKNNTTIRKIRLKGKERTSVRVTLQLSTTQKGGGRYGGGGKKQGRSSRGKILRRNSGSSMGRVRNRGHRGKD